jgi:integrase
MPRRKGLTEKQVNALPRRAKRYVLSDPTQLGLVLRVPPAGPVQYAAVAWHRGRQKWRALGTTANLSLDEARALARDTVRKIAGGKPLAAAPLHSVAAICDMWLRLKVTAEGYRTGFERKRIVEKYVKPHLGDRAFTDLRRSEIADWHDLLAERHGGPQAGQALKTFSAICRWYERRDDQYRSPIPTGGLVSSRPSRRDRVLSDDEIRVLWRLADQSGPYGAFLQLCLLLGQRRTVLATLRWDQIDNNGVLHLPREKRAKGNAGALRLPKLALDILHRQPRLAHDGRVFRWLHSRDAARFRDAAALQPWVVHDLRRSWRSLASRAGTPREHNERAMGHAIGGVEGIYDKFDYFEQKSQAVAAVAALIERIILNPVASNVVNLGAA